MFFKSFICCCLFVSVCLWSPGSSEFSGILEDGDSDNNVTTTTTVGYNITTLLKDLQPPYNETTVEQAENAQVGDECTVEAWEELTKPFWEQNFDKNRSEAEKVAAFRKAHIGWAEKPKFAGKSCFNGRHVRQEEPEQEYPSLALKCESGKCVCYNDVLGDRHFNLYQIEVNSDSGENATECLGTTGSNCNTVLFPCVDKNNCTLLEDKVTDLDVKSYECKKLPDVHEDDENARLGRKASFEKDTISNELETINDIPGVNNELKTINDIPGVNDCRRQSIASMMTVFSLGAFAMCLI